MSKDYRHVQTLPKDYFTKPNRMRRASETLTTIHLYLVTKGATHPSKGIPLSRIVADTNVERSQAYRALAGADGKGRPGFVKFTSDYATLWYFDTNLMETPEDFSPALLELTAQGLTPIHVALATEEEVTLLNKLASVGSEKTESNLLVRQKLDRGRGSNRPKDLTNWEDLREWVPLIDVFHINENPNRVLTKPTVVETAALNKETVKSIYTKEVKLNIAARLQQGLLNNSTEELHEALFYTVSYLDYLVKKENNAIEA